MRWREDSFDFEGMTSSEKAQSVVKTRLFLGCALYALCLLVYIIAFSSPYWYAESDLDHHHGLWRFCTYGSCHQLVGLRSSDWLSGAQAMSTLGLILAVVTAGLLVTWCLIYFGAVTVTQRDDNWYTYIFELCRLLAAVGTILIGVFGLLTVIIYGAKYHQLVTYETADAPNGWAFWLMVISSLGFLALGAFFLYLACNSQKINVVRARPEKVRPVTPIIATPPPAPSPTPPPPPAPVVYGDTQLFSLQYKLYPHNSPVRSYSSQRQHEKEQINSEHKWGSRTSAPVTYQGTGQDGYHRGPGRNINMRHTMPNLYRHRHFPEEYGHPYVDDFNRPDSGGWRDKPSPPSNAPRSYDIPDDRPSMVEAKDYMDYSGYGRPPPPTYHY